MKGVTLVAPLMPLLSMFSYLTPSSEEEDEVTGGLVRKTSQGTSQRSNFCRVKKREGDWLKSFSCLSL